jgi:hypothetical protein
MFGLSKKSLDFQTEALPEILEETERPQVWAIEKGARPVELFGTGKRRPLRKAAATKAGGRRKLRPYKINW